MEIVIQNIGLIVVVGVFLIDFILIFLLDREIKTTQKLQEEVKKWRAGHDLISSQLEEKSKDCRGIFNDLLQAYKEKAILAETNEIYEKIILLSRVQEKGNKNKSQPKKV